MTAHPVGVIDTNVIILLERLCVEDLPAEPVVTTVTLAELSVGPLVSDDPVERAARQSRLQETESAVQHVGEQRSPEAASLGCCGCDTAG